MSFVPHGSYPGVAVKVPFPDGDEDHTNYHTFVIVDDTNGIHMEVEELGGGNTEFRIYKNGEEIWKLELPFYLTNEGAQAYAAGIRTGMQLDIPDSLTA